MQVLTQRTCRGSPQAWWTALRTTMMTTAATVACLASLLAHLKPAGARQLPDISPLSVPEAVVFKFLASKLLSRSAICQSVLHLSRTFHVAQWAECLKLLEQGCCCVTSKACTSLITSVQACSMWHCDVNCSWYILQLA